MDKITLKKAMGENIRRERIARNLSIEELAELLEKTTGFIGLLERGHRGVTAHNCLRLSEIFNIPLEELFEKHPSSELELRDERIDVTKFKRMKVNSLITDLTAAELDFLITMIKEIKKINTAHRHNPNDEEDLDEDD